MDPQPRLAGLQFGQGLVRFDQFLERFRVAPEPIVILGHPVDRELANKKLEALFLEDAFQRDDRALGEVSVGRHINLLDAVIVYEKFADLGELRAQEWFTARQVQVLNPPQVPRESENLFHRQIVALIQVLPIKTMLTCQIADGIDEQDEKRWC